MKINYCLHTHTYRCNHAQGEDEEYVKAAIDNKITLLGFSDHVFLPKFHQNKVRGDYKLLPEYVKSINSLKNKYKDKISILLGFECEYFDEYKTYYQKLLKTDFDYLILGQHFIKDKDVIRYVNDKPYVKNRIQYVKQIEKGLKSHLFLYLAHPDYIFATFKKWNKSSEKLAYQICHLAKKYHTPIEINIGGMMWGNPNTLHHPLDQFWKIAGKVKNEVVIGYDAHNPNYFYNQTCINRALNLVKKYKLKLLNKTEILDLINS